MVKKNIKKKKVSKKTKRSFPLRERTDIALKNFIIFLIITIFSLVMYKVSTSEIFINLFGIISLIFGFLTLAFFIAFIILILLKLSIKKK